MAAKKLSRKWIPLLFVVILLGCDRQQNNKDVELYSIDATKIIAGLSLDSPDLEELFIMEYGFHAISPTFGESNVRWAETDFQLVAHALLELSWKQPADYWKLYGQLYEFDCADPDFGPISATYTYERKIGLTRDHSSVMIQLYANLVTIVKSSNHLASPSVAPIDRRNIIAASDALAIAESNGGYAARSDASPDYCYIEVHYIQLESEESQPFWRVTYTDDIDIHVTVWIDALTGEVYPVDQ